jgi:hypothetical protein
MSEQTQDTETQVSTQDELAALKARADMMGVTYHPSIGLEKLREKVNAAIEGKASEPETPEAAPKAAAETTAPGVETEGQRQKRLKDDAHRLVRVRLTCMNPAKSEWPGEIISVGNAVVGSVSKYIPFNADEGWHIPNIIYQHLKERTCQTFHTVQDSRGNKTRKGKLIKEFSIEVLDPLTPEELHDLAQRQAMAGGVQ